MNALKVTILTALAASVPAVARADAQQVPGHAIVARAEGKALVIWDATPEVADIVKNKSDDASAKLRLEKDALSEIALEEPKLGAATSVSVRIVYTKSGDVSPVYGSPTFAGVERYATLTLSAADAKADRDKWKESALSSGSLPSWIDFSVTGELPPR